VMESVEKFQNPDQQAVFGTLAIVVTVISIVVKEGMAQFSFWIARKTDNTSVKADGWHHRSDAFSSVVVLVGIFLQKYFWWIDAVLGICVSLILLYAVYKIVREAVDKLMGECVSPEMEERVKKTVAELYGEDLIAHHFHIHHYGNHSELTFHIKLDPNMPLQKAHEIADNIEKKLRSELNVESTIHIEPLLPQKK
ncbi:MAG: cation transporter, partial [Bacteroidales bacterium]|nr:cation transporter [Bacteroidales bacterium]